jgi:hypothetical protein
VVLEKNGEDHWTDHAKIEEGLHRVKDERRILHGIK